MKLASVLSVARRALVVVLVLAAMTLLVLWLSGMFGAKIPATRSPAQVAPQLPEGVATVPVATVEVAVRDEAVGTVRAVQEVQLASRVLGRVATMHVTAAGQAVAAGDVLVELDDAELRARLGEARAAVDAATEAMQQAERDLARTRELFAQQIAAARDLERDETAAASARAGVARAEQNALAAETMLGWATIRSPISGVVVDKLVEQGDTVAPGQVLMVLYDPERMQLVASVREQLANQLTVGSDVEVGIDALGSTCHGTVAEIVPLATSGSRAFEVKVTGPCPPGVFTGMFGRLFVPLGTRTELQVPAAAVRSIGQIDQVYVVHPDGTYGRRFVVLGDRRDASVAVNSGLRDGEVVIADAAALLTASGR